MTTSKLYITRAVKADTGNYTCAPKFSRPDSVFVHVVNAYPHRRTALWVMTRQVLVVGGERGRSEGWGRVGRVEKRDEKTSLGVGNEGHWVRGEGGEGKNERGE
ncbi:hypothetical protein E2C01_072893 [Portunus trituberculatus]|uniref:Ig-like domain-containing protein n=1 Tax=Portunus trituberculatus TaxID=210409 RepID=A0A5B7IA58_PORTR|nr:hypothetical protein [Portunus trituberculatus]